MTPSQNSNVNPLSERKPSDKNPAQTDSSDIISELLKLYPGAKDTLIKLIVGITSAAGKVVSKVSEIQTKVETTAPERAKLMEEAGAYLKDLREVAGLTVKEVCDAIKLSDQSVLMAVEKGTSALSFELILRLSAVLARHDPVPFVIYLTRTFNPEVWSFLENWGVGKLPLQLERERRFMNIYRSRDEARELSDEAFERVLEHTESAFDMALKFVRSR